MSEFFVRRPIVAIVIAILMVLIGGVCILALPIAQYPQIAPTITIKSAMTIATIGRLIKNSDMV